MIIAETCNAALALVQCERFEEARATMLEALQRHPNQINLLIAAVDVRRACGDREGALPFAQSLVKHHPANGQGYVRTAQELARLQRLQEARRAIKQGLELHPEQFELLLTAVDVERAIGDLIGAFRQAELVVEYYPSEWRGYEPIVEIPCLAWIASKRLGSISGKASLLMLIKNSCGNCSPNLRLITPRFRQGAHK